MKIIEKRFIVNENSPYEKEEAIRIINKIRGYSILYKKIRDFDGCITYCYIDLEKTKKKALREFYKKRRILKNE